MPRLAFIALASVAPVACSQSSIGATNYALMPESMASELLKQCSRGTPHASGTWTPSRDQLTDLENHLPQLAEQAVHQGLPQHIGDPKASFRQYAG
ncbi:MAG TPA: hypothetical protein VF738_10065, partial [Rhodanobacter sp.]